MTETTSPTPERDATLADNRFVDYYVQASKSSRTLQRFRGTMRSVLGVRAMLGSAVESLDVADVGCNTGTQALLWADHGHRVRGVDINEGLLEVARTRNKEAGRNAVFSLGSATRLPWDSSSVDVCLLPELLEHVEDWKSCLSEAHRVLRIGGTLYLSTTNALCPVQNEFAVPFYSWFPDRLKKRYERLAVTTRPELVNHARFPAVHWFTPYGLARHLKKLGFETLDRFDAVDPSTRGAAGRAALGLIKALPPLRWLAHVATPYTVIIANKRA